MKKQGIRSAAYLLITLLIAMVMFSSCTPVSNEEYPEITKRVIPEVTFSALYTYSAFDVTWGEGDISRDIMEKTGVELQLWRVQGSQYDALKVMLSSKSYPELLLSVNNDVVATYTDADALIPLDDYIEDLGVNIPKVFGDDLNKMRYDGDGKIYGLNRGYKEISSSSDALFHVQYAMLKEFNYPELHTLDELYELMRDYKYRYPKINNEMTIGLSAWAESYGMNVTLNNTALQSGGYQNDGLYTVQDNLTVTYGLKTEAAKEYFRWLNKLYREGLLDPGCVIQDRNVFRDKITSGRVLVATTPYWDLNEMETALREQGMNERCYAPIPLTLNEDIESHISNYDPLGSWKTVITDNCHDPQRAFEFFDQMWSEEMQVLCNWGIEGIHHEVIDGQRVLLDEINRMRVYDPNWQEKTELQLYNFWCMGENAKGSDGQYISPFGNREDLIRTQDDATKDALDAYGIEIWKDLCPTPQPSEWGLAWTLVLPQNSLGAIAETKVQEEIRRKLLPQIIMAESDDEFVDKWSQFQQEIDEAGIQEREKEISKSLQERMKSWN